MIDYEESKLENLVIHRVGNQTNQEDLNISKKVIDLGDKYLNGLLMKYFAKPFAAPEFFNFTFSDGGFDLNPIANYCKNTWRFICV
jgi:hypothetical protein